VKQLIELSGKHLSIRAIARRLDISRSTVRKCLRAPGVPIPAGTDAGGHGHPRTGELRCLVDAGLTPKQALRAGTQWAAPCLALEREVGTLEKGRLADLVVVQGNPLNVSAARTRAHRGGAQGGAVAMDGARRRHNDETLSLEAALPRHLPRDVEEDLEQALPVTDEAGRLLTRADISPMTTPPRQAPTRLHHGCCELVGDCSGRVKSGFPMTPGPRIIGAL
jgi:hypothetical protein